MFALSSPFKNMLGLQHAYHTERSFIAHNPQSPASSIDVEFLYDVLMKKGSHQTLTSCIQVKHFAST